MATRWGIISAGRISNDFVTALKCLPKADHQVVGIAARSVMNAEEFAKQHNIPKYFGSYEELLKLSEIEVVYIGVLHPQHYEVAKMSLEYGKHVLCEKPLCMNEKEAKQLIELSKEKKLFLMEAVWSRCFPIYKHLQTLLEDNTIGEVVHLSVQFGAQINRVERMWKKELGGGTVLDLGIYTIQLATLVFGNSLPHIVASGHLNSEGVDEDMTAVLTYPNGGTAVLSTDSRVQLRNDAIIIGSKGYIKIKEPFWAPSKLIVSLEGKPKDTITCPLPLMKERFNFVNSVGLSYEATEVRACLLIGLLESPSITHEDSIHLAKIEDEIRNQLGVRYPQDL